MVVKEEADATGVTLIVCPICGKFRFSLDGKHYLTGLQKTADVRRYKISHVTRSIAERAFGKRDNSFSPVYSSTDFEKMLDQQDPSVQQKLQMLLNYVGSLSGFPGEFVELDFELDFPVLAARNKDEVIFYAKSLQERMLLSLGEEGALRRKCSLSANGWLELEKLAASGAESSNAFVAMWFDSSRQPFETAINKAVTNAGYLPVRIDRVEHLNRIDDEILTRIRQSKFLIADFTGQRNGVYFEAGFVLGLGRPVIWVCERADLDNVHF